MAATIMRPPTSTPTCDIRLVNSRTDLESVARLRYEVYVQEMGRSQTFADASTRAVHEPLDHDGIVIGAYLPDGTAIGTLRLNSSASRAIPFREIYGWEDRERQYPGQVFLGSKLIVSPERRGQLLAVELLRRAYREALGRGWRFGFLDANDHLVSLYSRVGFRSLAHGDHPLFGKVTIMELDLHDAEHMRSCRSPLLRDCLDFLSRPVKPA